MDATLPVPTLMLHNSGSGNETMEAEALFHLFGVHGSLLIAEGIRWAVAADDHEALRQFEALSIVYQRLLQCAGVGDREPEN